MTATLSRVGSCRTANKTVINSSPQAINNLALGGSNHVQQIIMCQNQISSDTLQMHVPSNQQSPQQHLSMRTSKILNNNNNINNLNNNINNNNNHLPSNAMLSNGVKQILPIDQHQTYIPSTPLSDGLANRRLSSSMERERRSESKQLANNLANISLRDGLAFASLRAPKNSHMSIAENLANSKGIRNSLTNPINGANVLRRNQTSSANKLIMPKSSSSSSPDRNKQVGSGVGVGVSNNTSANDNSGNKSSSVWFEYGCV